MVNTLKTSAYKHGLNSETGLRQKPSWEHTHNLLLWLMLTLDAEGFLPRQFSRNQLYEGVVSFGVDHLEPQAIFYHLEGRGPGGGEKRKVRRGFVDEEFLKKKRLPNQTSLYEINKTFDTRYNTKLSICRMLVKSSISALPYDLPFHGESKRAGQLLHAFQIDPVVGWNLKGRLDSDLRIEFLKVVLRHLLRGIALAFTDSVDENRDYVGGSFSRKNYRLNWVLDPSFLAEPTKLQKMTQTDYAGVLERVWKYIESNPTGDQTRLTGALILVDINELYWFLLSRKGRKLFCEALTESSERYKRYSKHLRDIHEPQVYPKSPRRTWLYTDSDR